jgi:hypothetical protein
MWNLVEEIAALPDVAGAGLFDGKGAQLCGQGEAKLAPEVLETLGLHTVRLFQMGAMSNLEINTVQFVFDRCAVLAQHVPSGEIFLVLCAAHADCGKIAATITARAAASLPAELEPAEELAAEECLLEEEPEACSPHLQVMLDKIEQALVGAVGPVAGMVMQDYIDLWRRSGPAVPARLVELTKMLVDEIGEPEAAQDFIAQIEQII